MGGLISKREGSETERFEWKLEKKGGYSNIQDITVKEAYGGK